MIWDAENMNKIFNKKMLSLKNKAKPWHLNQTKNITGTENETTFDLILDDKSTYEWNCLAYDQAGNSDWSDENWTLIINSSYNYPPYVVSLNNNPQHEETGVSLNPILNITVADPEGTDMNVTFYGRELNNTNFTIIVLPDTQKYSWKYPEIFTNQSKWIVSQKDELDIVFVTHEGDIVENYEVTTEWDNANNSMSELDDQVPYGVLPGNHDMDVATRNTDNYNTYFPVERYENEEWWGGNFSRNDNNYQLFSAGGQNFIIFHIEYRANGTSAAERQPIYTWINNTLETYQNRSAIIVTHDYMDTSAQRSSFGSGLWNNVIKTHPNVFLVLAGHSHSTGDGEANRTDPNNAGKPVHQVMADYQEFFDTGPLYPALSQQSGFLRIMKFVPLEKKIYIKTFSPYLTQTQCEQAGENEYRWNSDAAIEPIGCYRNHTDAEFTLNYEPFNYLGEDVNVANNTDATFTWKERKPSTTYEWFVEIVDSDGVKNVSLVWNFTTGSS